MADRSMAPRQSYALDRDGKWVEPTCGEASGPFTCPDCDSQLILQRGKNHRPSFAHKDGEATAQQCGRRFKCAAGPCRQWTKLEDKRSVRDGCGDEFLMCPGCVTKCTAAGCGSWMRKPSNAWVALMCPCPVCGGQGKSSE